jgi:hypothetical protein
MGGMGRDFDGGYAQFTCVPASQVQAIKPKISWEQLGALPEMMQTAWGSLIKSLQLKKDDSLLIRGGKFQLSWNCPSFCMSPELSTASTYLESTRVEKRCVNSQLPNPTL